MKIHIPAFVPMAKCNEHLAHGPIDIDLGENVVVVVRCKDCEYWEFDESEYRENPYYKSYCEVWGHQCNGPDGYCSAAKRRDDNAPD